MIAQLLLILIVFLLCAQSAIASSVVINEIMADPQTGNEWVELYNSTNSTIDLAGWIIQEKTSSGNFNSYTLTGTINQNSHFVYEFSGAKLNNTDDTVNLINTQNSLEDTYSYSSPQSDLTYSRIPDGGSWNSNTSPTKGSSNGGSSPIPTPTPSSTSTPSPTPSATSAPTPTPTPTPQASFTFSNAPSQINSDQSFTININLSLPNNPNTVYYLKGAFKKTDGTRYFGLSKKDNDWIEYGDEYSEQYKITTNSSGAWLGNLEIKPDIYDNDYKGAGDYIFKIARLTSSGSGPTWSNESTIKISSTSTPSPSAVNTPKPTSTSTPRHTTLNESNDIDEKLESTSSNKFSLPNLSSDKNESSIAGVKTEAKIQKNSSPIEFLMRVGSVIIGSCVLGFGGIHFKNKGLPWKK